MTATDAGWRTVLDILGDMARVTLADREPALTGVPVDMIGGEPSDEQRAQAEQLLAELGVNLEWGKLSRDTRGFGTVQFVRLLPGNAVTP
jgi:hypothetical protein